MFWLGYMKLKESRLKKITKSKIYHCALLPISNLYGGYIKGLGKETGEFSHHVFCGKLDSITQKQRNNIFFYNEGKKYLYLHDKAYINKNHSLFSSIS